LAEIALARRLANFQSVFPSKMPDHLFGNTSAGLPIGKWIALAQKVCNTSKVPSPQICRSTIFFAIHLKDFQEANGTF
jgi:hypothetical protein